MDDVICLFNGTLRQIDKLFNFINSIDQNIQFTKEIEKDNKINFLDLTITKHQNQHQFSIYRKPTQSDITIHNESNHPYPYKIAAYNSMVHRALTYPLSTQEKNNEFQIIKQIAQNNGFQIQLIDNLIKKHQRKKRQSEPQEPPQYKFIATEYIDSNSSKIAKTFKKYNCQLAFKTKNNIGMHIHNTTTQQIPVYKKSGVYQYVCHPSNPACNKTYIGHTARSFEERFKEHTAHSRHTNPSSTVAKHIKNEQCSYGLIDNNLKVLKTCNDKLKSNVYEQYFIYKYVKNNNQCDLLNIATDFKNKVTYHVLNNIENPTIRVPNQSNALTH